MEFFKEVLAVIVGLFVYETFRYGVYLVMKQKQEKKLEEMELGVQGLIATLRRSSNENPQAKA